MTIVRVGCVLLLVVIADLLDAATARPRIAFLDKGEVWTLQTGSRGPQRQTRASARIEDFEFSPGGEYLAYAKRMRPADERPICSIVIVDVATGSVITEIQPDDGWIDIDKWIGTKLLYHASSGLEVSGFFEFDAARRTRRELDPPAGSRGLDTDLSRDGTLLAYVDNIGVGPTFEERLHLVHTATGADAIAVSKRSLMAPAISSTNDAVAFVEVFEEASTVRDRVWVYRRRDGTSKILSAEAVTPKSAGSGLKWSPDDRYLLVNFGNRVTVLDTTDASPPRKFRGMDACWLDARTVVAERPTGLEAVNIVTGIQHLLVVGATHPQCS